MRRAPSRSVAFGDNKGIRVTFRDGFGGGAVFGLGIAEEQMIGDVFVVVTALLGQVVDPSEQFEERADQLLLGGGLVYGMKVGGVLEEGVRLGAKESKSDCWDRDSCQAAVRRMPSSRK